MHIHQIKARFYDAIKAHRAAGMNWHDAYKAACQSASNEYVALLRERGASEEEINNILADLVNNAMAKIEAAK